ncbi:MAG TPA: YfcE family phosphodiesterase, partial [Methanomassiliicoccales archaeon]|nr:YfcE family phosphodiesterase [Methanomassiliicoccales archaeon]
EDDGSVRRLLAHLRCARENVRPMVRLAEEGFCAGDVPEHMRGRLGPGPFELDQEDLGRVRAAALPHVRERLRDIYALEDSIDVPDATERQHELRIAIKRLRYTLEIFSPAFGDELRPYIKQLKQAQDLLGDMHDCDVWIAMLQRRKGAAIAALLTDRRGQRSLLYGSLVDLWRSQGSKHFFPELEAAVQGPLGPSKGQDAVIDVMHATRIALLADVHGNLPALRSVLKDMEGRQIDLVLNAGDTGGIGPYQDEVTDVLAERKVISVMGHNDDIGDGDTTDWPDHHQIKIGERAFLLTHASPSSLQEGVDETTPQSRLERLAELADADVVVLGHTHRPLDRRAGRTRFINPGSVGEQNDGDPRAAYAVLDLEDMLLQSIRVPYPVHEMADRALRDGGNEVGPSIYLLSGTPMGKRSSDLKPLKAAIVSCENLAKDLGQWDDHVRQVRDLSLQLFERTRRLHRTGNEARLLLEASAILHDIGWSWGGDHHNRSSHDLILSYPLPGMTGRQRLIVASVARYHRGPGPKKGHANFALLDKKDKRVVRVLASLLRIADGLDVSHQGNVRIVGCTIAERSVSLRTEALPAADREAALKKADLFVALFGKELVLE